jgi:hypothetical protein
MFLVGLEPTQNKALSGAPLLALPKNIRLGWKALLWTNTLAYYEHSYITRVKSFINGQTYQTFFIVIEAVAKERIMFVNF